MGVVAAATDPLVRAVVERAGKTRWILDPGIGAQRRGARAGLEWGVSLAAYRLALDKLKGPRTARNDLRAHRARLEELFDVMKPPDDPCDPASDPTSQMDRWTVHCETYPGYGRFAGLAIESDGSTVREGDAAYAGLSGYAHPSVMFGFEHAEIDDHGAVTITRSDAGIEKAVRVGVFSMCSAYRYWTTYYGLDPRPGPGADR